MNQKIHQNLKRVNRQIRELENPETPVKLVVVTKTRTPKEIASAISAGAKSIGENKIQEAEKKFPLVDNIKSIEKRFIGKLQTNKIKKAINLFDTIDSVESLRVAKKISTAAYIAEKEQRILIQINTSKEKNKSGFEVDNKKDILSCFALPNLKIEGMMTMGPADAKSDKIKKSFYLLKEIFNEINKEKVVINKMTEISMGMSGDFVLGISCGSSMVRLGTAIFGERKPHA